MQWNVLGLVLVLATVGCGPGRVSLRPPTGEYRSDDYERVLDEWTRSGRAYEEFESRIFVHGTYCSLAFRRALLARKADFLRWDRTTLESAWAEERKAYDEQHEFVVAVFTHQWKWNDLDEQDSMWQLWLQASPGGKVRAASIERLRRRLPEWRALFPHATKFYDIYRVRFPKVLPDNTPVIPERPDHFYLHVDGAMGNVSLRWDVTR